MNNKEVTAVDKANAAGEYQKTNEKLQESNTDLNETLDDFEKKGYTGA